MTDASNHGPQKIFPVLVRYFDILEGVKVKILDCQSQPRETSEMITNYLAQALEEDNLTSKIVSSGADNTNCNFGGASRNETQNVYFKLKNFLGLDIFGIGFAARIIHNSILTAADDLPGDIKVVVVKIYSYFYIYSQGEGLTSQLWELFSGTK